ncbi:MAG: thioredoxin family protein [Clostridia bacterium]
MLNIDTGISFVKFSATWCGPCKMVSSTIQKVQPDFPEVKFQDIDVDDNPDLAKNYKIKSVPTVILFRNGIETTRLVGNIRMDALKKTLRDAVNGIAA